jgi:histidinol-phosphate aminotransferase
VHLAAPNGTRVKESPVTLPTVGSPTVDRGDAPTGQAFFRAAVAELTPYQPGKPVEDVQRELGLERVIKLASNEGPFGPFPSAQEAMARAASDLNRYPDGGAYRLHQALAERHGVEPGAIAVGAGADGCIDMLSQAILGPGDEVVCGWPSFPSYLIYANKQGATPVAVPLHEHRYDLTALLAAVTARTKLVYICHPNNPTGTMNTADELDAYFDAVPDHVLTVVDQAYFEYIDHPDYPDAVERYLRRGRRVVVLRTFSKIYGLAGLRIGYAVGPAEVCTTVAKVRRPFDLTTPAQVAALASIAGADELARRRAVNTTGLALLGEAVRANGLEAVPSVGNFIYVDIGTDANVLFEQLLREGVIVRPLAGFGSPTAIRVSVGTPDEIGIFTDALGRILATA